MRQWAVCILLFLAASAVKPVSGEDCNDNGIDDACDIDCGVPGGPCDFLGCGTRQNCNENNAPDECDITDGTSEDCNINGIPDECESNEDCNRNGARDICDLADGTSEDCNGNGFPDECDLPHNCCETGHGADCSDSIIAACVCRADDWCCSYDWHAGCVDLVISMNCGTCGSGYSSDCDGNDVPDECDPDSDDDGIPDDCDDCPDTVPGSPVGADGCPLVIPCGADTDGDVDGDDYAFFESCASGPAVPLTGDCSACDFDGDADVDHEDFGVFQRCYSGENNPADPNCAD